MASLGQSNGSKDKEVRAPAIPSEWKVELPEFGAAYDDTMSGCRSIEDGYERQCVLGQGTYGEVFRAMDRYTGDIVAAKKIKMDNEKEGFPITAIREIKILSALAQSKQCIKGNLLRDHVITLREIVRSSSKRANNFRGSIYMVFDYMDHDMTGLLARAQREGPRFTAPQIKCYMQQLLLGLALLESNKVLHRDLKNSNLLINNHGILKIGDFGLARYRPQTVDEGPGDGAKMTNRVITLWYRPPELLLGSQSYGPEIDIWSAGCIMFELLTGKPLFSANDELGMCEKIFGIMGKANEKTMPGCTRYSNYQHIDFGNPRYPNASQLRQHLMRCGITDPVALNLMESMLKLDPAKRTSARAAAQHVWFTQPPLPMRPEDIPKYAASHEMGMKRARQEAGQRRPGQSGPSHGKYARMEGPGTAHAGPRGAGVPAGHNAPWQQQRQGSGPPGWQAGGGPPPPLPLQGAGWHPGQQGYYGQGQAPPVPGAQPPLPPGVGPPYPPPPPAVPFPSAPQGPPAQWQKERR